jgi:hypothetical protein
MKEFILDYRQRASRDGVDIDLAMKNIYGRYPLLIIIELISY